MDPHPSELKEARREASESTRIRHDIQQTRSELAEALDALEDKLRPGRVVQEARRRIEPKIEHAVEATRESMRKHPRAWVGAVAGAVGLFVLRGMLRKR